MVELYMRIVLHEFRIVVLFQWETL